jgi:hypothetical protein
MPPPVRSCARPRYNPIDSTRLDVDDVGPVREGAVQEIVGVDGLGHHVQTCPAKTW